MNPPLVGGVAFTRQGRCQEREEVLGTTKPPYSLVLAAALLRDRGFAVQVVDLTATGTTVESLIARLDAEHFHPTLIVFPSTTPTLVADTEAMAVLKDRSPAPLICFGPHASTAPAESMARAGAVDGMLVGEPEDGLIALAGLSSAGRLQPDSEPHLPAGPRHRPAAGTRVVRRLPRRAVSSLGPDRPLGLPAADGQPVLRPRGNLAGLSVHV